MLKIGEKLLAKNREDRKEYITKYEELVNQLNSISEQDTVDEIKCQEANIGSNNDLICPRCGEKLILRTAKKGDNVGQQFYGCSGFPKCRYTKS